MMDNSGGSYYDCLNIDRTASQEDVRDAYFSLARQYHPDVNSSPDAADRFVKIQQAYDVLSNKRKRRDYDLKYYGSEQQGDLKFSIKFSQPALPRLDEEQMLYMMAEIAPIITEEKLDPPPIHLCIVLDRSTSMQGSRMDMVKANLLKLVKEFREKDSLSLVTFSDRAQLVIPPGRITQPDILEGKIAQLTTGGGTEIYRGLELGMQTVQSYGDRDTVKRLFLLTDGHTYGDEIECLELAAMSARQGIPINILGFGGDWNDEFLDQFTKLNGGTTTFVTSREGLYNYFTRSINEIQNTVAKNLALELGVNKRVKIGSIFRMQPEIGELVTENTIYLGNLTRKNRIRILFEMQLQPVTRIEDEIMLADGFLVYDLFSGEKQQRKKTRIAFCIPVRSSVERETPPAEIVEALARMRLYRMQAKARVDVEEGRYLDATRRMHNLATHLLAQGERELAKTVLLEMDSIQKQQGYSPEGAKQIKYGTKALLRLPEPKMRYE